jgi:hypothetical protein
MNENTAIKRRLTHHSHSILHKIEHLAVNKPLMRQGLCEIGAVDLTL